MSRRHTHRVSLSGWTQAPPSWRYLPVPLCQQQRRSVSEICWDSTSNVRSSRTAHTQGCDVTMTHTSNITEWTQASPSRRHLPVPPHQRQGRPVNEVNWTSASSVRSDCAANAAVTEKCDHRGWQSNMDIPVIGQSVSHSPSSAIISELVRIMRSNCLPASRRSGRGSSICRIFRGPRGPVMIGEGVSEGFNIDRQNLPEGVEICDSRTFVLGHHT